MFPARDMRSRKGSQELGDGRDARGQFVPLLLQLCNEIVPRSMRFVPRKTFIEHVRVTNGAPKRVPWEGEEAVQHRPIIIIDRNRYSSINVNRPAARDNSSLRNA